MTPGGSAPERISMQVEGDLNDINIQTNIIRMAYDTRHYLLHLFITPIDSTTAGTHYVYDTRLKAWMKDQFASYLHDPHSVHVLDADDPDDRALVLGCKDGYIRRVDASVSSDDGTGFESYCWLNPIRFREDNWAVLKETRVTCSGNTDSVKLSVYGGHNAETALSSAPAFTRNFTEGENYSDRRRATGAKIFFKYHDECADAHWSIESTRVRADSVASKRKRFLG
jgi:hypothetical protein